MPVQIINDLRFGHGCLQRGDEVMKPPPESSVDSVVHRVRTGREKKSRTDLQDQDQLNQTEQTH